MFENKKNKKMKIMEIKEWSIIKSVSFNRKRGGEYAR